MTTAKPFRGHIAVIQRNAIRSWTLLSPRPEAILFGDEQGAAQWAAELGLLHVPNVARNHYGTPFRAGIFAQAERRSTNDLFAYINADIILPAEFMHGLESIRRSFPRFLAVGRRTNLDVTAPLDVSTRGLGSTSIWRSNVPKFGRSKVALFRRCRHRLPTQPHPAAEIPEVAVPAAVGADKAEIVQQELFKSSSSRS